MLMVLLGTIFAYVFGKKCGEIAADLRASHEGPVVYFAGFFVLAASLPCFANGLRMATKGYYVFIRTVRKTLRRAGEDEFSAVSEDDDSP